MKMSRYAFHNRGRAAIGVQYRMNSWSLKIFPDISCIFRFTFGPLSGFRVHTTEMLTITIIQLM